MKQIGRYQIVNVLGHGGMGVVYRAEDPAIGRSVAIKTIRLGEFTNAAERERLRMRLLREARSAGRLSHPAVVTIYDVSEDGDTTYIFMEFVDGHTLHGMLEASDPLPKETILSILHQTAEALDYAHGMGIIHRDIKPANIMIAETGAVKITDFGVAKIQSEQMTQTGALLGTPHYMSPEQIQGAPLDGRSDQFALAVIAYEMLTGQLPHNAETLTTLILKLISEPPQAAQAFNSTLGAGAEKTLVKALSKKPEHRYASCTEFASALEAALNSKPDWQPVKYERPSPAEMPATGTESSVPTVVVSSEPPREAELQPAGPQPKRSRRFLTLRNAVRVILPILVLGLAGIAWRWSFSGRAPAQEIQPPPPPVQDVQPPSPESLQTAPVVSPPNQESTADMLSPAPPPKATAEAADRVRVTTNPPGAMVVFDGNSQSACTTPCSTSLSKGRHTAAMILAGYHEALRIIEVPRDIPLAVALDRITGTLICRTTPPGAAIILNGRERSEKTPAKISLPAGKYKLELVKEGFPKYAGSVEIKDQVISTIEIDLGGSSP